MFSFTNGVISSYLLSYSKILGIANIGLYFTLNAAALFIVRPFAGKLMDRSGLKIIAYPGLLLTALSMFMLASAGHWPVLPAAVIVASGIVRAIGQGSVNPALQTECIRVLGTDRSGVATSSFYLGGDIGQGIGPMVAGVVIGLGETEAKYYSAMFYLCGILVTAAIVLFYFVEKRVDRTERK
jgi:MFS family permease